MRSHSPTRRPLRAIATAVMALSLVLGFLTVANPSEASASDDAWTARGMRVIAPEFESPDYGGSFGRSPVASIDSFFAGLGGDFAHMDEDMQQWYEDNQPETEQPAIEQPAIEQPAIEQPAIEQPAIEQPAIEQPETEQPVLNPGTDLDCAAPFIVVDDHCVLPDHDCNDDEYLNAEGECTPVMGEVCGEGFRIDEAGDCRCDAPFEVNAEGDCEYPEDECEPGQFRHDEDCIDIEDPCYPPAEKNDAGECVCPAPYSLDADGKCYFEVPECEDNMVLNRHHECVEAPAPVCFPPFIVEDNHCVLPDVECDADEYVNAEGECTEIDHGPKCEDHMVIDADGNCFCPAPFELDEAGECDVPEIECEAPAVLNRDGKCVEAKPEVEGPICDGDLVPGDNGCECPAPLEADGDNCVPPAPSCPEGAHPGPHGECVFPEAECFPPAMMNDQGECELVKPACMEADDVEAAEECFSATLGRRSSS